MVESARVARRLVIGSMVVMFLIGSLSANQVLAQEEIVIEGENRQPTESSFEYRNRPDSPGERTTIGTEDVPSASPESSYENPELEKSETRGRSDSSSDTGTLLKEEDSNAGWWGLAGLGTLILIVASG